MFADENELSRSRIIVVFQEIMYAQSEVFKVELGQVVAIDGKRIEIVFFKGSTETPAFLIFAPEIASDQQDG